SRGAAPFALSDKTLTGGWRLPGGSQSASFSCSHCCSHYGSHCGSHYSSHCGSHRPISMLTQSRMKTGFAATALR
ncbi:MAG TPA: hypothetical protein VFT19_13030, partial [Solirubrobacterales bacterium]|nr:hypothetical protein [Solirubrobacterales bacterium]